MPGDRDGDDRLRPRYDAIYSVWMFSEIGRWSVRVKLLDMIGLRGRCNPYAR